MSQSDDRGQRRRVASAHGLGFEFHLGAPCLIALLLLLGASAVRSQTRTARMILFVGNSFTFGDRSPVRNFHPERVTNLNKDGYGGVPVLFKMFTSEAGFDYDVTMETSPGKSLEWHYTQERPQLQGKWDV